MIWLSTERGVQEQIPKSKRKFLTSGKVPNVQDMEAEHTPSPVSTPGCMIIQFIGDSRKASLIYDKPTIRHLLELSPFAGKYIGQGRTNSHSHELVLNIVNKDDIDSLVLIDKLIDEENSWPIACRKPVNQNKSCYRVLKGIHPAIPDNRIKNETTRNSYYNNQQGIYIEDVQRFMNYQNGTLYPTWNVKIEFIGEKRPESIMYDNELRYIHPFFPKLVVCANCSKTGHVAIHCNRPPRCGRCGKSHEKRHCRAGQSNVAQRRCPNCNKQHYAKYAGCEYIKVEKAVLRIHAEQQIPKDEIRKQIWASKEEGSETTTPATLDTPTISNTNKSASTRLPRPNTNRNIQENRNPNIGDSWRPQPNRIEEKELEILRTHGVKKIETKKN